MAYKTVTLTDSKPCRVRVLELYELDAVPFDDIGEYEHVYENGQRKRYTLADWPQGEPETPPVAEELAEVGSLYWAMWRRHNLYQSVLTHRMRQVEASEKHAHDIARYVIQNCVDEADRARVVSPADLEAIYQAALVSEVSMEEVEAALAGSFQGFIQWEIHLMGLEQAAQRGRGNH